jgi:hypothetical protein
MQPSFLPNLTCDAAFVYRIVSNGWFAKLLTFILNEVRTYPGADFLALATVRRRLKAGMDTKLKACQFWKDGKGGIRWSQKDWTECLNKPAPVSDYTSAYFDIANAEFLDRKVLVSSLRNNVTKMPQGADRGLLTMAIEIVAHDPAEDVYLAELDNLITKHALVAPLYGATEDQEACKRWMVSSDKVPARTYTHEEAKSKARVDE